MENTKLVYSSDDGIVSGYYGKSSGKNKKKKSKPNTPKIINDGFIRVQRDSKGRRGKTATTVSGIPGTDSDINDMATIIKKKCGCGGSAKDGIIVIQGDKRDVIKKELENMGYKVKLVGG